MKRVAKKKRKKKSNGEEFLALPDSEKERIYSEIDSMSHEEIMARSRPLNARERRRWQRFEAKARRPA
jgi:hypothetical protein